MVTRNIYKTHYQLAIFVLCSQPELIPVFLSSWAITQCSIVLRHALDEVLNLLSGVASVMGCNVATHDLEEYTLRGIASIGINCSVHACA